MLPRIIAAIIANVLLCVAILSFPQVGALPSYEIVTRAQELAEKRLAEQKAEEERLAKEQEEERQRVAALYEKEEKISVQTGDMYRYCAGDGAEYTDYMFYACGADYVFVYDKMTLGEHFMLCRKLTESQKESLFKQMSAAIERAEKNPPAFSDAVMASGVVRGDERTRVGQILPSQVGIIVNTRMLKGLDLIYPYDEFREIIRTRSGPTKEMEFGDAAAEAYIDMVDTQIREMIKGKRVIHVEIEDRGNAVYHLSVEDETGHYRALVTDGGYVISVTEE